LCDFSKLRRLGLLDGMKERPDFIPVYQAGRRKRIIDILVSSVALVALFPVIVLISVMILIESGWPIFYISKRVGSGYHVFNFYKFRTMRKNADRELGNLSKNNQYDSGEMGFVKIANDPRVTKLGAFLRKTSLDELPQLVNVLKGDMSLVGNRPLPLYEAATLTKDEWALRFLAPAGLTGLWQVSKRGKKEMSADERMSLDIQYAREGSMRLDFEIIFRTFSAMMQEEQV
jgi:lipopolysaccharide/colanic/teichoic acid biosynthesis glycosyltransferase